MRKAAVLLALTLAACGQNETRQSSEDLKTYDTAERASPAYPAPPPPVAPSPTAVSADLSAEQAGGPNISVTAAPGVAFNYRYAYRLANARIQAAQETHAQMCEKLTVARCRITGMRYSLVNERDISAALEMKIDPRLARQFGKDATKAITDAEGMLVDQQISGTDMTPTIEGANRGRAELQDELDRVNRELARPGLSNVVRDRLLSEASALRGQIRALGEQKQAAEDSLATTPMAFFYGSGRVVPGFEDRRPLADAIDRAGYGFQSALGLLIMLIATVLPWALLLGLGYWLLRRFGILGHGGRSYRRDPAAPEPEIQP